MFGYYQEAHEQPRAGALTPASAKMDLTPFGLVFLLLAMPWLAPAADMMSDSETQTMVLPDVSFSSSSWTSGVTNSTHFTIEEHSTQYKLYLYTSAAIDANDKIHVAYYDTGASSLKYATDRSGTWVNQTIDSGSTTINKETGEFSSIAVDSQGKAHISYVNRTSAELMHATDASGVWETTALHSLKKSSASPWSNQNLGTSIAIDSNDAIHISYVTTESQSVKGELRYTTNANGTWVSTTVDSDDSGSGIGKYSDIAIDSNDKAHIVFQNTTSGLAGYAHNKNGTWEAEYISGTGGTQGRVRDPSIALDSNDGVHITYTRTTSNWRLGYAKNTGGSWTVLNSIGTPSHGTNQVGAYPSIAIDSN
ncbi:MAG TPA: hypothetical protein QF646_06975, partial [Candidatus Poseidoniales archaeon]|nr:hypothetical protein [Candidatus Poseidoniales archaeon]